MTKVKLVESFSNNSVDQVIEDIGVVDQPDFTILDVTVISDDEYNPTIQSILIDLSENQSLTECESLGLGFNILSETVNDKTGYSHSLFEFESKNKTITLNLSLNEHEKYDGVFKVAAHTTKGELVFESNTQYPAKEIKKYLNTLTSRYLKESEGQLSPEEEIIKLKGYIKSQEDWISYLKSRNPNHGDLSFAEYQLHAAEDRLKELQGTSKDDSLKEGSEDGDVPVEEQPKQEIKPINSTFFIRRPVDLEELQGMIAKRLVTKATYSVVDEISLSNEEYDNYTSNLRQDVKFLSTFRPSPENTDFTCIAVISEDRPTLLIDNSGYDSAQYVGIV